MPAGCPGCRELFGRGFRSFWAGLRLASAGRYPPEAAGPAQSSAPAAASPGVAPRAAVRARSAQPGPQCSAPSRSPRRPRPFCSPLFCTGQTSRQWRGTARPDPAGCARLSGVLP